MTNLKEKIKNLSKTAKAGLVGLSLATLVGTLNGCGREIKEPFCKELGSFKVGYENGEKYIIAYSSLNAFSNYRDNRSESFVVGSLLESFDSKEIQKIYNFVKENGIDCDKTGEKIK